MICARSLLRSFCRPTKGISSVFGLTTSWDHPKVLCNADDGVLSLNISRAKSGLTDSRWLKYNDVVFPPTEPGEPERPAEIYYENTHIRYDPDKMWCIAVMVRGMSVDEAKKQLTFKNRMGAQILKNMIEDAQLEAVNEHNVEFKSNLWIAECYVRKAPPVKGVRKHARGRFGKVCYQYIHVYLKLREGKPPKHYYPSPPTTRELVEEYIQGLRRRRIINSL